MVSKTELLKVARKSLFERFTDERDVVESEWDLVYTKDHIPEKFKFSNTVRRRTAEQWNVMRCEAFTITHKQTGRVVYSNYFSGQFHESHVNNTSSSFEEKELIECCKIFLSKKRLKYMEDGESQEALGDAYIQCLCGVYKLKFDEGLFAKIQAMLYNMAAWTNRKRYRTVTMNNNIDVDPLGGVTRLKRGSNNDER